MGLLLPAVASRHAHSSYRRGSRDTRRTHDHTSRRSIRVYFKLPEVFDLTQTTHREKPLFLVFLAPPQKSMPLVTDLPSFDALFSPCDTTALLEFFTMFSHMP